MKLKTIHRLLFSFILAIPAGIAVKIIVTTAHGPMNTHLRATQAAPQDNTPTSALWRIKLPDQSGHLQSLSQYYGQPLIINFWASWCEPCIHEMAMLTTAQKDYASKNIHFIGIAIDSAANVTQFIKKVKVGYPLYIAGFSGTQLAYTLGNTQGGLPFTLIIDASGKIRAAMLGRVGIKTLRQQLDGL